MPKKLTSSRLNQALQLNNAPVFSDAAEAFYDVLPENHGFVATLQLGEYFIPSLMIKLSEEWGKMLAPGSRGFADPRFSLSQIGGGGNMAYLATLNLPKSRKLHLPLDSTHPHVLHFFEVLKESNVFAVTLRVGSDPRKYSLYTEVEASWKSVIDDLQSMQDFITGGNDFQQAVAATRETFAPNEKHHVLNFLASSSAKVMAEWSEGDIKASESPGEEEMQIDTAWLAETHDIYLKERPPFEAEDEMMDRLSEVLHERETLELEEILKQFQLIEKDYPDQPDLLLLMQNVYIQLEQPKQANEMAQRVARDYPDVPMTSIIQYERLSDPEVFKKAMDRLPQPLNINDINVGGNKVFAIQEFLTFESVAIRYDCMSGHLEKAMDRFDRLVRCGFAKTMLWGPANEITFMRLNLTLEKSLPEDPAELFVFPGISSAKLETYLPATLQMLDAELVESLQEMAENAPPETFAREDPKVGRNDPCPCGSGKKYKKCCWGK